MNTFLLILVIASIHTSRIKNDTARVACGLGLTGLAVVVGFFSFL